MKKNLLIIFFAFAINVSAQVILEHTYDSASAYANNRLSIVKFEVSGERYVRINIEGKTIDLYGLNHAFIKSISYSSFPQATNNVPVILYLSENLFDADKGGILNGI